MAAEKTQGLQILLGAGAAGLLGHFMIADTGWGLGIALWGVLLSILVYMLQEKTAQSGKSRHYLFILFCMLSLCLAWREDLFLNIATVIACVTLGCLIMEDRQIKLLAPTPFRNRVPSGVLRTGIRAVADMPGYLRAHVDWTALPPQINRQTARSSIRGVAFAMPWLAIYGLLLSQADDQFYELLLGAFDVEVTGGVELVFRVTILAFISATFLYGTLVAIGKRSSPVGSERFELSMMEIGIILGLINLMFFTFVVMQVGYLFGGIEYIQAEAAQSGQYQTRGALKYYTRRGFFELVAVVTLSLPLLMGLQHYFRPISRSQVRQFHALAGAQVVLLLLLLVSAGQRMWLYTDAFGVTNLRFYSSVFMVWIAIVLAWFGWTTLRGYPLRFVRGAALAGVCMVLGLNVLNPNAIIVNSNLNRAMMGARYDSESIIEMGTDAMPGAIALLPVLPENVHNVVVDRISQYWHAHDNDGWRGWSYSKYTAQKAIQEDVLLLIEQP